MEKIKRNNMLLNNLGRVIPSKKCRVFSQNPKTFYKLNNVAIEYRTQHKTAVSAGLTDAKNDISEIEANLEFIKNQIINSQAYKNLFNATAIPFCLSVPNNGPDFGTELEDHWLPLLKTEFEKQNSGAYFKASFQGNQTLSKNVKPFKGSGYANLLEQISHSTIVGYYFPTAFQEFDVDSQRRRTRDLPKLEVVDLCLSGPCEIVYSLICYPNLLFDKQNYSPILCASSLEHNDPRMIMLFKSYGPHLEFWLMSQMLTPDKTQVSEQWSGGITIYKCL